MISVHDKISQNNECVMILPDQIMVNLKIMDLIYDLIPRFKSLTVICKPWMFNFWKTFQPYFDPFQLMIEDKETHHFLASINGLVINLNDRFYCADDILSHNLVLALNDKNNFTLYPPDDFKNNPLLGLNTALRDFLSLKLRDQEPNVANKLFEHHFQNKSKNSHVSVFCTSESAYFILGLKFNKPDNNKVRIYFMDPVNKHPLKYENVVTDFYHILQISYSSLKVITESQELFDSLAQNQANIQVEKIGKFPIRLSI